jgi:hypothetical protein
MNKNAKEYLNKVNLEPLNVVKCSDWHLTWGLGTNKLGKLYLLDNNTFFWYGASQGRHGQKYGSNFIHFDENLDKIFGSWSIDLNEVRKSVNLLKNEK